jgi:hypothetical protein
MASYIPLSRDHVSLLGLSSVSRFKSRKVEMSEFIMTVKERALRWRFSLPIRRSRITEGHHCVEGILSAESPLQVFIHQSNLLDLVMREVEDLKREIQNIDSRVVQLAKNHTLQELSGTTEIYEAE